MYLVETEGGQRLIAQSGEDLTRLCKETTGDCSKWSIYELGPRLVVTLVKEDTIHLAPRKG